MVVKIEDENELLQLLGLFDNFLEKHNHIFLTVSKSKDSLKNVENTIKLYSKQLKVENYYNLILLTDLSFEILNRYFEDINILPTIYYFKDGFLEAIFEGYLVY